VEEALTQVDARTDEFNVVKGETITIRCVAVATADIGSAVFDSTPCVPAPNQDTTTYHVTITRSVGKLSHFGFSGLFQPNPPSPNAEFDLFLQGSNGGGEFPGPRQLPGDKSVVVTFVVTA